MTQQAETLLTPEVKALIGQTSDVSEMYGEVDSETVRRFALGIPDQDPRYWDEDLAKPRFGTTTTPPLLVSYMGGRQPPWAEDTMDETMYNNWFHDSGRGPGRAGTSRGLPALRTVAKSLRSHLHAGDEFEVYQYPKIGDKIYYQRRYADIQEKVGRRGRFLLVSTETRYWNQNNETLLIVRTLGIES